MTQERETGTNKDDKDNENENERHLVKLSAVNFPLLNIVR